MFGFFTDFLKEEKRLKTNTKIHKSQHQANLQNSIYAKIHRKSGVFTRKSYKYYENSQNVYNYMI